MARLLKFRRKAISPPAAASQFPISNKDSDDCSTCAESTTSYVLATQCSKKNLLRSKSKTKFNLHRPRQPLRAYPPPPVVSSSDESDNMPAERPHCPSPQPEFAHLLLHYPDYKQSEADQHEFRRPSQMVPNTYATMRPVPKHVRFTETVVTAAATSSSQTSSDSDWNSRESLADTDFHRPVMSRSVPRTNPHMTLPRRFASQLANAFRAPTIPPTTAQGFSVVPQHAMLLPGPRISSSEPSSSGTSDGWSSASENAYGQGTQAPGNASKLLTGIKSLGIKGELYLSINLVGGIMTVAIDQGRNMMPPTGPACNSYVRISLVPDDNKRTLCKTKLVTNTNEPVFNETFSFEVLPEDYEKRLLISSWHRHLGSEKSQLLGCMAFNLKHLLEENKQIESWYFLMAPSVGRHKHLAVEKVNVLTYYGSIDSGLNSPDPAKRPGDKRHRPQLPRWQYSANAAVVNFHERYFVRGGGSNSSSSTNSVDSESSPRSSPDSPLSTSDTSGSLSDTMTSEPKSPRGPRINLFKLGRPFRKTSNIKDPKLAASSALYCSVDMAQNPLDEETCSRKLSAPVDFRLSGVYIGEPKADPVLERLRLQAASQTQLDATRPAMNKSRVHAQSQSVPSIQARHPSSITSPTSLEHIDEDNHGKPVNSDHQLTSSEEDNSPRFYIENVDSPSPRSPIAPHMFQLPSLDTALASQKNENCLKQHADCGGCSCYAISQHELCEQPHFPESSRLGIARRNSADKTLRSKSLGNMTSTLQPPSNAAVLGRKSSEPDRPTSAEPSPIASSATASSSKASAGGPKPGSKKFNFLRRDKEVASTTRPSRNEARLWADSFENLLNHKYGVMLFRAFLQREFSDENIEFWLACEDFKRTRNATKMGQKAQQIYSDFVAIQSPKEVNLDSKTRDATMEGLDSPNDKTFDQAQARIVALMEKDSYPRFLKSELYLELVK